MPTSATASFLSRAQRVATPPYPRFSSGSSGLERALLSVSNAPLRRRAPQAARLHVRALVSGRIPCRRRGLLLQWRRCSFWRWGKKRGWLALGGGGWRVKWSKRRLACRIMTNERTQPLLRFVFASGTAVFCTPTHKNRTYYGLCFWITLLVHRYST